MAAPTIANVVGQDGELRGVPAEHLDGVLRSGAFRLATPQETAAYWREQDYGGAGQAVAAGAEGAASALTFGVAPKLETSLGLTTPEAIQARREEHPVAHGMGTVVGIAAPLLLTGGAAAPLEAGALGLGTAARGVAELTAPALIARAGRGAAALAEAAGLPGVVGRLAPAVAGAATEGALYAGSDVTEKALLGDPQLTWEKAASEVGLGALFGGALGGGGKALSELLPSSLAESMADTLGTTAGNRNLKAAAGPGGSKALIGRLQKQYGRENLTRIGQEMGEMGLVGPLSSPEGTIEAARALKEAVGADMGDILVSADATGAGAPAIRDIAARARQEVLKPLMENPLEQGTARQVADFLDAYEAKYSGAPTAGGAAGEATALAQPPAARFGFGDIHEMRRQVSDKLYGLRGTQDPGGTALKEALHDFRSLLSEELDAGLERANLSSQAWKAANRKYTVASVAHKLAEDGALKHVGNNLLSLTEIMAGLTGAGAHGLGVGTLAALGTKFAREKASGLIGWAATGAQRRLLALAARSDRALSASAKRLFLQSGEGLVGSRAAEGVVEHLAAGGAVGQGNFAGVAAHLRELSGNIDGLAETVGRETSTLQQHAPATADAARAFAARVVQHLASKLPESGQRQLLDPPFEPSRAEVAEFNRHHEVAKFGPVAVLEHAARGTLHPDHVAASEALYPRLHAEAQQLVAAQLADHLAAGERVPIARREAVGMLLGADLEHAATPTAVLSAQRAFEEPPATPPGPGATPGGKPRQVETKFSGRLATSSERTGASLNKGIR